jgi:hypothetical protein
MRSVHSTGVIGPQDFNSPAPPDGTGDAKLTTRAMPVQFRVDGLRGAHSELTHLPKSPPATPEAWDAKVSFCAKRGASYERTCSVAIRANFSTSEKKQRLNQLNRNAVSPLLSINRCGISSRLQFSASILMRPANTSRQRMHLSRLRPATRRNTLRKNSATSRSLTGVRPTRTPRTQLYICASIPRRILSSV